MSEHTRDASSPAPERARIAAPRSERRRRTVLVGVRLTPEEHADLLALAGRHGKTGPELLRLGLTYFTATEAS